jgi:hypothetical protein
MEDFAELTLFENMNFFYLIKWLKLWEPCSPLSWETSPEKQKGDTYLDMLKIKQNSCLSLRSLVVNCNEGKLIELNPTKPTS